MLTSTLLVLHDDRAGPGAVLRRPGAQEEHPLVLIQVFVGRTLITVLWCIYGYSPSPRATPSSAACDRLFLNGTFDAATGTFAMAATFEGADVPSCVFVAFPATLRRHHLLPDRRRDRRAREVLRGADLPGHLVHVQLPADRAHGLVLDGPGRVHRRRRRRRDERARPACCGSGARSTSPGGTVVHINAGVAGLVGAVHARQARRLRPRGDAATTTWVHTMVGARCCGWLVRLQRRLGARAQRLAALAFSTPSSPPPPRGLVDPSPVGAEGHPSMLGAASGAVAGPVAITPAAGKRRHPGAFVIGLPRRRDLPLGRHRPEDKILNATTRSTCSAMHASAASRRAADRASSTQSLGGPGLVTDWVTATVGSNRSARRCDQAEAVGVTVIWSAIVAFIALQGRRPDRRAARHDQDKEREVSTSSRHGERAYAA